MFVAREGSFAFDSYASLGGADGGYTCEGGRGSSGGVRVGDEERGMEQQLCGRAAAAAAPVVSRDYSPLP